MFVNAPGNNRSFAYATLSEFPPSKGQCEVEADGLGASAAAPVRWVTESSVTA